MQTSEDPSRTVYEVITAFDAAYHNFPRPRPGWRFDYKYREGLHHLEPGDKVWHYVGDVFYICTPEDEPVPSITIPEEQMIHLRRYHPKEPTNA